MKVVAFLQNMWVRDPERVKRMIERNPEARAWLIRKLLFYRCRTGRRLRMGLGEEWCKRIVWEESTPVILDNPKDCPAPDVEHIKWVLEKYDPSVVICFTAPAAGIVRVLCGSKRSFFSCNHPACRQKGIVSQLRELRTKLDELGVVERFKSQIPCF